MSIKHKKVSNIPNGSNNNLIQPNDWNDVHIMEPAVKGLLYDEFGDGNITGLHVTGLLNDPFGDGNIVGVHVTGVLSDPDGDGNYTGIKVTGLWKDDGNGNISGVVVKGLHYDAAGNNVITGLRVTGLLQDKLGDGTITGVQARGLLNDPAGNGNYSGVQFRGLLMDKAGNGVYSGVTVQGFLVDKAGNNDITGLSSSTPNTYLRRGAADYEFGTLPAPTPPFAPNAQGLLVDKLGNNTFTGVQITGVPINPTGDNNYVGVAASTYGQYLRRSFNENPLTYAFSDALELISTDFYFVTPNISQSLIVGSNTITLSSWAIGVTVGNKIVIYDAIAGIEVLSVTAANAGARTLTVTCAIAHTSGNWHVRSATAGIQEAIVYAANALPALVKGFIIRVPAGLQILYSGVILPGSSSSSIHLRGDGKGATRITHHSSNMAVSLFTVNSSGDANSRTKISGMTLYHGFNESLVSAVSSNPGISLTDCHDVVLEDIEILDGYMGFLLTGASNCILNRCSYTQSLAYASIGASQSGLRLINGIGACVTNTITNCSFTGQFDTANANALASGIEIYSSDRNRISNCLINGKTAIVIYSGNTYGQLEDLTISNCIISNVGNWGIYAAGDVDSAVFNGLYIFNNVMYGSKSSTTTKDGIYLTGKVEDVIIANNSIMNFGDSGITIGAQAVYYAGNRQSLVISGNAFRFNGRNDTNTTSAGINASTGLYGAVIVGNAITNKVGIATQKYGIYLAGTSDNNVISDNKITGNVTAAMNLGGTITATLIANNRGVDDVFVTVIAASTINTPGGNVLYIIQGTLQIATILPGWAGRRISLVFTDAAPGSLLGTGNIAGPNVGKALTINTRIDLVYTPGGFWM